jgi:hypothetical protein
MQIKDGWKCGIAGPIYEWAPSWARLGTSIRTRCELVTRSTQYASETLAKLPPKTCRKTPSGTSQKRPSGTSPKLLPSVTTGERASKTCLKLSLGPTLLLSFLHCHFLDPSKPGLLTTKQKRHNSGKELKPYCQKLDRPIRPCTVQNFRPIECSAIIAKSIRIQTKTGAVKFQFRR